MRFAYSCSIFETLQHLLNDTLLSTLCLVHSGGGGRRGGGEGGSQRGEGSREEGGWGNCHGRNKFIEVAAQRPTRAARRDGFVSSMGIPMRNRVLVPVVSPF